MISFACRTIDLREIVMCSFEINKTEYAVLQFLLSQSELITVGTIAQMMKLERSTVQKAIKTLFSKELVERRQINLQNGGYHYSYAVKDKHDLQQRLNTVVEGWYKNVITAISAW